MFGKNYLSNAGSSLRQKCWSRKVSVSRQSSLAKTLLSSLNSQSVMNKVALMVSQLHVYSRLRSQVFTVSTTGGCPNIAGLVKAQKRICRRNPKMMERVGLGANKGLEECQHQFRNSRWNCSDMDTRKRGLLGALTSKGIYRLN